MSRSIDVERRPADGELPELELRRSTRRRKTASAYARDGVIVVQLPAGLPEAEERRIVRKLVDRVTGAVRARRVAGDDELFARAVALADEYLDGVRPAAVSWSSRMRRRHGSCTPGDATIRISQRLAAYPAYVLDGVLVHELAHLRVSGHGRAFWGLAGRFPHMARARGFLEGVAFAEGAPYEPDDCD